MLNKKVLDNKTRKFLFRIVFKFKFLTTTSALCVKYIMEISTQTLKIRTNIAIWKFSYSQTDRHYSTEL